MSSLRDELRPLVPVFNAARRALDQSRWRLGMDVDDLIADIVLAVAKELSGPSTAVLDRLRAAEAERDRLKAAVQKAIREDDQCGGACEYGRPCPYLTDLEDALDQPKGTA